MKKFYPIVLALLMTVAMFGCGGLDEKEAKCLENLKTGLQARWDVTNDDYNSYVEYADNVAKGIEAELDSLEKYKGITFEDETFNSTIKEYIEALENQKKGISYIFDNAEKYNDLFIEKGIKIRSKCINQMVSDYGFEVDSEYNDTFKKVLNGNITPLVSLNEQVKVKTEYGEVGVSFIGYDILTNPAEEKELVLYCEIENISYYDEYNGETLIIDNFLGVYDGAGYNIESKGECYGYIDGYDESAGFVDLKKGEKGKFAVIFDYTEDIDILYTVVAGIDETYGCYLKAK